MILLERYIKRIIEETETISDTLKHNINFILNEKDSNDGPPYSIKSMIYSWVRNEDNKYYKANIGIDKKALIIDFIKQYIPLLTKNKLMKFLGTGAKKRAYLLNNHHVFLLSNKPFGWQTGVKAFKKLHDEQFSGSAKKSDLGVFDYGEIASDGSFYAETSLVIPLADWLKLTGRKIIDFSPDDITFSIIANEVPYIIENTLKYTNIRNADVIYDIIMSPETYIEDHINALKQITKDEIETYIRLLIDSALRHGYEYIRDVHMRNIGVSIHDPTNMVILDI